MIIISLILLIVGFILLIKGADWFVDGASSLAANFKVPKMIIALTIVTFGTSAPELAISLNSMIAGNTEMVLGNIIGSNIANIFLILGMSSLFHNLIIKTNTVKKELPIVILMTTLLIVLMNDVWFDPVALNMLTRSDGIVILLFFMVFVYYLIYTIRKGHHEDDKPKFKKLKSTILTVLGIAGIIVGSDLVVEHATNIATILGISQKFISLTVLAIGTSLPELVTSVIAAMKGEEDIAIGNVVGSCIFNIGCVLGLSIGIFGPITTLTFSYMDLLMLILSAVLLFVAAAKDAKITHREGTVYLILYAIYMVYLISFAM